MELIRGLHNLTPAHRGCVATIGNFDGLHLGHQAVLGQLAERAAELGLPTLVITFEPLPREYFLGARAPARLSRLREKLQALRRYSVDRVLCLRFNAALARMPAEDFIRDVLVDGLGVRYLVVGDDFRFGHERRGDFAMLEAAGRDHGFRVAHMYTHEVEGERVSSTRIREALQRGDLETAQRLLGRPYRMSGRVVHGDARGRTIGYPTANLRIGRHAAPVTGVFAVEVFGLDPEPLRGVANLGTRPTVGGTETRLEVHLFDFDQDIYGRHLQVDLLSRIREERRFDSLDDLVAQIGRDAGHAREYFDTNENGETNG
jgi:riboflavin kinase/FMN adenylyltransferase